MAVTTEPRILGAVTHAAVDNLAKVRRCEGVSVKS